jgi:hypothetical protein
MTIGGSILLNQVAGKVMDYVTDPKVLGQIAEKIEEIAAYVIGRKEKRQLRRQ